MYCFIFSRETLIFLSRFALLQKVSPSSQNLVVDLPLAEAGCIPLLVQAQYHSQAVLVQVQYHSQAVLALVEYHSQAVFRREIRLLNHFWFVP